MELAFIREMFDAIAPRYDFLNRLLSLRQDVYWRKTLVRALMLPPNAAALDMACGTGDVMLEILKQRPDAAMVAGVDFAVGMLALAREKLTRAQKGARFHLAAGNGLAPPFPADTFDAVTIAFGIRNIMDRKSALSCFRECLKPGGRLGVLELATPGRPWLHSIYLLYFSKLLPLIGALFSRHAGAYGYLPASVLNFPAPKDFADVMRQAGFKNIRWRRLTLGIATVYIGEKPLD